MKEVGGPFSVRSPIDLSGFRRSAFFLDNSFFLSTIFYAMVTNGAFIRF